MKDVIYIPNVKSQEEFLIRFEKLYSLLNVKEVKTSAEKDLLLTLQEVKNKIDKNTSLPYLKEGYNNMLPYFELGGGWEMMKSDIGKEATDLLYYFVQNYKK